MTGVAGLEDLAVPGGEFVHRLGVAGVVLAALAWAAWTLADRRRERRTRKRIEALLEIEPARGRRWLGSGCPLWLRTWAARWGGGRRLGAHRRGVGGRRGGRGGLGRTTVERAPRPGDRRRGGGRTAAAARGRPVGGLRVRRSGARRGGGSGRAVAGWTGRRAADADGRRAAARRGTGRRVAEVRRDTRRRGPGPLPGTGRILRAPAAEAVSRHAADLRADRARKAAARAQRAQVLITAPVGLCFLPAFLAVGVAPVVIGLATGLLRN